MILTCSSCALSACLIGKGSHDPHLYIMCSQCHVLKVRAHMILTCSSCACHMLSMATRSGLTTSHPFAGHQQGGDRDKIKVSQAKC